MSIRRESGREGRQGRCAVWIEAMEARELLSAALLQSAYWTETDFGRVERPAILQPTIEATHSSLKASASTPVQTAGAKGFQIDVVFPDDSLTADQKAAFETAATRWERVLTADIPDTTLSDGTPVDDLRIEASGPDIDGVGGILGQAGPSEVRFPSFLPKSGTMEFDQADLVQLQQSNQLVNVILHEMGHVLGFGTIWALLDLTQGAGTNNPQYVGPAATAEYNAIFGNSASTIPLENTGGEGTRDSHWRESVFNTELMTGFLNGNVVPLSRVTAAQFIDLGYPGVDLNAADSFAPAGGNPAPIISALTDSPEPVSVGGTLALTATGVSDDTSVSAVRFYRETNSLPGLQVFSPGGDLLLGTDTTSGDGYTAAVSTASLAPGTYTYYAQAEDNEHSVSVVRLTINTVTNIVPPTAAPTAVDLSAVSDTGASDSDNLTRFDNSALDQSLSFSVSGTIAGAIVTLYVDGTAVGSATAAGTSTTVVTNGSFDLVDGAHVFTARQTASGANESIDSPQLAVTVDSAAPAINALAVSGSAWSAAFNAYLDAHGLAGPAGGFNITANRFITLPWVNIDQFTLGFTEPVAASQSSLTASGVRNSAYAVVGFAPPDATNSVTWRIGAPISQSDRVRIALSGVTDLAGNALDGEPNADFPTGDGTAGGDFALNLNILPGDVDQSGGAVNASDLVNVRNRIGFTAGNPGSGATTYRPQTDINADGQINASDLVLLRNRIGTIIPINGGLQRTSTASATPAASLFADTRIAPAHRLADALLA